MNALSSLGLILLIALLAGHLVKFLRIPEVTGYILAGILVGPSVLGWLTHDNMETLTVFSEVALGLILFSVGSVFERERVLEIGPAVLRVTLMEAFTAGGLVAVLALLLGQPWQMALLLGAIAMETAAASTLMVLRECHAQGPLSETLRGIIAINNIVCLITFYLAASVVNLSAKVGAGEDVLSSLYASLFPLPWQVFGSVAWGYLVGLLISSWAPNVHEHGEMLILLTGCILLCVGVSAAFELSPLIASLSVGATMVNLSGASRRLFQALSRSDPPFYAIFFVLAGADLNLGLLKSMGLLGVAYVAGRASGKLIGARVGSRWTTLQPANRRILGVAMLSQAGLAVGLTLTISRRFPEYAPAVTTVVLAAVALFEIVGPVSARLAIVKSGEFRAPEGAEAPGLLDVEPVPPGTA